MAPLQEEIPGDVSDKEAAQRLRDSFRYMMQWFCFVGMLDLGLVFLIVQQSPDLTVRLILLAVLPPLGWGLGWLTGRLLPQAQQQKAIRDQRAAGKPIKIVTRTGARVYAAGLFVVFFGMLYGLAQIPLG